MSCGTKWFAGLALGLLAVLAASQATPGWAQDLTPVGYWALDDGLTNPLSTTAVDSSVNGNDGTLTYAGDPTWGTGLFDGALKFNGVADYVTMGNPTALDITGALSTSLWMGKTGVNSHSYATLIGKNESGGTTNDGYYVNTKTDGHIVFGITPPDLLGLGDPPVELISSNLVMSGSWHHVSTVYDPGVRMAIYVDGVLDSELIEGVPTAIRQVTTPFVMGNLYGAESATYAYKGYLDEVKVFNGVLGTTQIQSLATGPSTPPGDPTPANLVAHWTLDDGVATPGATTVADSTTPQTNGVFVDAPVWDTGQVGGALNFDGSNDRVKMTTPSSELDITNDLSMAFWIKADGTGASKYGHLTGKNMSGGSTQDAYFTDFVYSRSVTNETLPAGTIEFGIMSGGELSLVRSTTALSRTDGVWHHIAVTYDDGSRMAIYIDGVLDGELQFSVPDSCDSKPSTEFSLGNLTPADPDNPPTYGFNGLMDDVRVYTGVLTDAEILYLFNNEPPLVPGDTNGDGYVDAADAAKLASNWGAAVTNGATDGDFNEDDVVNAADAAILAANWNPAPVPPSEAAGVPEPTTLVLLIGGLFGLLIRRQPSRRG